MFKRTKSYAAGGKRKGMQKGGGVMKTKGYATGGAAMKPKGKATGGVMNTKGYKRLYQIGQGQQSNNQSLKFAPHVGWIEIDCVDCTNQKCQSYADAVVK